MRRLLRVVNVELLGVDDDRLARILAGGDSGLGRRRHQLNRYLAPELREVGLGVHDHLRGLHRSGRRHGADRVIRDHLVFLGVHRGAG